MNKIDLYTSDMLSDAKYSLISGEKDIIEFTNNIKINDDFKELIELSEKVQDIDGDIDLAIAIDKHPFFRSLTKEEATREELWATLNIEYFDKYTKNRWLNKNLSEGIIKQRIFKSGKLLFDRNSTARLWWAVKRTKDETLEDPYLYTKIILSRTQFEQSIIESSLAKNEDMLKTLMSCIVKYEEEYKIITSTEIKDIIKRFNLLGGTYVLDIMDEEFFYDELLKVLGITEKNGLFLGRAKSQRKLF